MNTPLRLIDCGCGAASSRLRPFAPPCTSSLEEALLASPPCTQHGISTVKKCHTARRTSCCAKKLEQVEEVLLAKNCCEGACSPSRELGVAADGTPGTATALLGLLVSAMALPGHALAGQEALSPEVLAAADSAAAAAAAATAAVAAGKYVPSAMEPGFEEWFGFIAGVFPFIIGSYEFGKRILIQRRCEVCEGTGLVSSAKAGTKYRRKCPQCGGFFPWVSWKMFLTSTAAPGNGGPLRQPKGQTSVFYTVPPPPDKTKPKPAAATVTPEQEIATESQGDAVVASSKED